MGLTAELFTGPLEIAGPLVALLGTFKPDGALSTKLSWELDIVFSRDKRPENLAHSYCYHNCSEITIQKGSSKSGPF